MAFRVLGLQGVEGRWGSGVRDYWLTSCKHTGVSSLGKLECSLSFPFFRKPLLTTPSLHCHSEIPVQIPVQIPEPQGRPGRWSLSRALQGTQL